MKYNMDFHKGCHCTSFIIIVLGALMSKVICTSAAKDPCSSKLTCSACIHDPTCHWCSDPAWDSSKSRCRNLKKICSPKFDINPVNNSSKLVDKPLVSYESNSSQVVQVAPQEVHLTMRINDPINITLKYARAEYPVDLYYLMDLSYSMRDDKDTLSSLGKNLQEAMRKYTSDFRLGFGSFVDKTVGPYINMAPSKIKEPCKGCTAPYGFMNHMQLSNDTEKFPDEVGRAKVSGNLDEIEGGFDALMQVIVCHKEIGWRENARRIVVFSTDSGFHMAGDGKLGGIVMPNDGECHMDESGMYTHSELQDYPSVSHLNFKIRENAINVVFAVTEPQLQAYTFLSKSIEGALAGSLTADSSNILQLVEEQYKKISSSVEMKYDAPDNVLVTFYTSCQNSSNPLIVSNSCNDLKIGEEVEFQVEMKVLSCPANPEDWKNTLKIFPFGSREATVIHLEMYCDCPCEHEDHLEYKENSPQCSNNGTYMCGICSCNSMYFGQKCECASNQFYVKDTLLQDCKADNNPESADCSGRGVCYCGVCQCDSRQNQNEIISGKYCECDNFSCLRGNGELCGGHGTCECGKCHCYPGWTGEDCLCPKSNEKCISSENDVICSDHGGCICGTCVCDTGYDGRFCEQFAPSAALRNECGNLLPCVLCQVHKTGPLSPEDCEQNCSALLIETVDKIEENEENTINCVQFLSNECRCEYQYLYNDSSVISIKALNHLECPITISALPFILGILGTIILGGIFALALWKIITIRKDNLEFQKFINEQERAKWDQGSNPLYRQPVSTFRNPTYEAFS